MIIAGAGIGSTTTLLGRISHLVRISRVPSCVIGLNDDAYDGDDIGNVHLSPV